MKEYCVKCQKIIDNTGDVIEDTIQGSTGYRKVLKGKCEVCGTIFFKILNKNNTRKIPRSVKRIIFLGIFIIVCYGSIFGSVDFERTARLALFSILVLVGIIFYNDAVRDARLTERELREFDELLERIKDDSSDYDAQDRLVELWDKKN